MCLMWVLEIKPHFPAMQQMFLTGELLRCLSSSRYSRLFGWFGLVLVGWLASWLVFETESHAV
jgi:dolichyl-phosphate-mannose--protein O-mannosyl transferase